MNDYRQALEDFTAGWLVENMDYPRPLAEDIAKDFMMDDFPANRIRTIPEAAAFLQEVKDLRTA